MTDAVVAGVDLSEWARVNVSGSLGFSLLTDTYDPAHLLHQFIKLATGIRSDETFFARQIVAGQGARGRPLRNLELRAIAEENAFSLPESDEALNHLRKDLALTLAADGVVFKTEGSFQIASSAFTGENRSAGDLAARLFALVIRDSDGRTLVDRARQRLASPQRNGFWVVEDFLRSPGDDLDYVNLDEIDSPELPQWLETESGQSLGRFVSHLLKQCLRGIAFGEDPLYAIRTLALGLTWCASLLAIHAPSVITNGKLLPLLVEVKPASHLSSVKTYANEESYGGIARSYDQWLHSSLEKQVEDDWTGLDFSKDAVVGYLRDAKPCIGIRGRSASERATRAAQDSACRDAELLWRSTPDINAESSRSFATAEIARMLRGILRAGLQPETWYSSRARYCGFLYPRRKGDKRLTFEPALLPLLVLGLFDEGEISLDLSVFLERARTTLGLIVGPDQAEDLSSPGPAIPELESNLVALIESLVQLGLARSFGDSVTEVLYPTQLLGIGVRAL